MSQKMNAAQIAFIINDCLEGVERSKCGPVFLKDINGNPITDINGFQVYSAAGFNVFMNVLSCYFPKNFNMEGPLS